MPGRHNLRRVADDDRDFVEAGGGGGVNLRPIDGVAMSIGREEPMTVRRWERSFRAGG
jgi:hypothetical protein